MKAYNEIADFCYKKLVKGDNVLLYGTLNNKMEIVINEIEYTAEQISEIFKALKVS